ncbi:MAG TPA: VOC family protein [Thermoanaerobaculia bacterium]|jgi:PhnB protein|nr:VOC family protein [Thermoanaerobaculia bacterium]
MAIQGGRPDERRVVAHLMVPRGREAVDFYVRAFGGELLFASEIPGTGRIVHAHVRIGDSVIMVTEEHLQEAGQASSEERFQVKLKSPGTLGGTTTMLELYVDDVDTAFPRALEAGAKLVLEPADMFYGDRYGILADPFGHVWALATVKEMLTPAEVTRRAMALFAPAH